MMDARSRRDDAVFCSYAPCPATTGRRSPTERWAGLVAYLTAAAHAMAAGGGGRARSARQLARCWLIDPQGALYREVLGKGEHRARGRAHGSTTFAGCRCCGRVYEERTPSHGGGNFRRERWRQSTQIAVRAGKPVSVS